MLLQAGTVMGKFLASSLLHKKLCYYNAVVE